MSKIYDKNSVFSHLFALKQGEKWKIQILGPKKYYFFQKLRHERKNSSILVEKLRDFEKKTQKSLKKLSLPEALTPKSSKILVKKKPAVVDEDSEI